MLTVSPLSIKQHSQILQNNQHGGGKILEKVHTTPQTDKQSKKQSIINKEIKK